MWSCVMHTQRAVAQQLSAYYSGIQNNEFMPGYQKVTNTYHNVIIITLADSLP